MEDTWSPVNIDRSYIGYYRPKANIDSLDILKTKHNLVPLLLAFVAIISLLIKLGVTAPVRATCILQLYRLFFSLFWSAVQGNCMHC